MNTTTEQAEMWLKTLSDRKSLKARQNIARDNQFILKLTLRPWENSPNQTRKEIKMQHHQNDTTSLEGGGSLTSAENCRKREAKTAKHNRGIYRFTTNDLRARLK